MTTVSKIAGGASILSSIYDIHKSALAKSREEGDKVLGDYVVQTALGSEKSDTFSYRDSERKNWINEKQFFTKPVELFGNIAGYIKGFGEGIVRYIPQLTLGSIAIFANKNKKLANMSAIALGIVEAYDFLKNSTGLFQKTDYLKRK